ncbi:MAG: N6-L-threonylcarbamoyladenine synthase [Polyangiales bacterium]|jgi:N6-L-threonylcarbamoyladenine synthase
MLGIETSCDETAAAVVDTQGHVYSNIVASQIATHAPYGGVVPELASRAHLTSIVPVIEAALQEAGQKIDAVAVTCGPGLVGALLVGVQSARAFAMARSLPLVGVNHLDGHLLAANLKFDERTNVAPQYPFVALLVSGGHTALYRVDDPLTRSILGQTRDDAAGEAFDKVAKLMGLGYPGGPVIDRLAAQGDADAHDFPRPMLHRKDHDFSFSGLKTAVARHVAAQPERDEKATADIAASFQRALVEVLARKSIRACKAEGVKQLVLGGGVAANRGLRARVLELAEPAGIHVHIPPIIACTDNAAMIAYAGALRFDALGAEPFSVFSRDPARVRGRFRPDGTLVPRRTANPSKATR